MKRLEFQAALVSCWASKRCNVAAALDTVTSDPSEKLCGSAGEILNGQFTYTGVEFGDTARAACDRGSGNALDARLASTQNLTLLTLRM